MSSRSEAAPPGGRRGVGARAEPRRFMSGIRPAKRSRACQSGSAAPLRTPARCLGRFARIGSGTLLNQYTAEGDDAIYHGPEGYGIDRDVARTPPPAAL